MLTREIVRFCSIECKLQQSGELSVGWMVDAWIYAQDCVKHGEIYGYNSTNHPTVDDVLNLGRLIEPVVNNYGFRKVDVRVGWDVKMDWSLVPSAMVTLMETLQDPEVEVIPEEFFKEYEDIHPFRDGNGRTGVILYNWLKGTLDDPVWAPNFWDDPRRTVGFGA